MTKTIEFIGNFITAEYILKWKRSNGGDVIAIRTILMATKIFFIFITIKHFIDPERSLSFSFFALRKEFVESISIYAATIGGIYLALYSRFSSQWQYLATLYNQIKETEITEIPATQAHLSMWKAGFIEDAEELHLANKGIYSSVIYHWGQDPVVRSSFISHAPGGEARFNRLIQNVNNSYTKHCEKWQ